MVTFNTEWEAPKAPELQEYLKPTEYGDMDNPVVMELAQWLVKGCKTPREYAIKLWDWIVDNIKFCYEPPKPTIEVLRSRDANCFNRSNLQMSLLRLCGVPARMSYTRYWKKMAGIVVNPIIVDQLPITSILHNSAAVYLNGRWIEADLWPDRKILPYDVQWNGNDDLVILAPDYVYGVVGYTPRVLVKELDDGFKGMQATKKWCSDNLDPYAEFVRSLPRKQQREHYENVIGKAASDNWALHIHLRSATFDKTEINDMKPKPDVWHPSEPLIVHHKEPSKAYSATMRPY